MNTIEYSTERKDKSSFPIVAVSLFLLVWLLKVVLFSMNSLMKLKLYLIASFALDAILAAVLIMLPFIIKNKVARFILLAVAICYFLWTAGGGIAYVASMNID